MGRWPILFVNLNLTKLVANKLNHGALPHVKAYFATN